MLSFLKVNAKYKLVFDTRGLLLSLFKERYENSRDFIIKGKNNQAEDILVYEWILGEWVLIQCWEVKITDLYESIIGSNLLKSELQRNSKRYPHDVLHLCVMEKPSPKQLSRTKFDQWHIQGVANSILQEFPWIRYSFRTFTIEKNEHNRAVVSHRLLLGKIAEWIKHPPEFYDCGIPVLNVGTAKNIITAMAAAMDGITTELATYCIFQIKDKYHLDKVCWMDLSQVALVEWEQWFKEIKLRNQKVLAKKWFINLHGDKAFFIENEGKI